MRISQAAVASGCNLETIRYYERMGLVAQPPRTPSGYRIYGAAEVERLRFISRGRNLGFSLDEIRSLLSLSDNPRMSCSKVDAITNAHIADIRRRVLELNRMMTELERMTKACAGGERRKCTILRTLAEPVRKEITATS